MDWSLIEAAGLDEKRGFAVCSASLSSWPAQMMDQPVLVLHIEGQEAAVRQALLARFEAGSAVRIWTDTEKKWRRVRLLDVPSAAGQGAVHLLIDPEEAVPAKASPFSLSPIIEVMRRLREEGGCPWDRAQTHETLRTYLIQEVYEVIDAIQHHDRENLKEELGDVLYQVVFHARLAEEEGWFTMQDVVDGIAEKMRIRHPYVFGTMTAGETAAALESWEARKIREKKRIHLLSGLSASLPSLLFACIMQKKVGSICGELPMPWNAARKRLNDSLTEAGSSPERSAEEKELRFGEALFQMVRLARLLGVDPELALGRFNRAYAERFSRMEDACRREGRALADIQPGALQAMEKRVMS